jgi:hypothetical protein
MDFMLRDLRRRTHVPERGLNVLRSPLWSHPLPDGTLPPSMLAFRLVCRDRDEPAQEGFRGSAGAVPPGEGPFRLPFPHMGTTIHVQHLPRYLTGEPVSAPPKRKLENRQQRPAPETCPAKSRNARNCGPETGAPQPNLRECRRFSPTGK